MSAAPPGWSELEQALGHTFRDRTLLERALTHSSYANERQDPRIRDNESFEFLGDAILGFLVAELLHHADPDGAEGTKSRRRAALVRATSLTRRAEALGLPAFLRIDRNEERTGGRAKTTLWSDAFEAVLAAIYLDGGLEPARAFVSRSFAGALTADSEDGSSRDFKTELQERLQAVGRSHPEYRQIGATGPPHDRVFRMACVIEGVIAGEAEGRSKKQAQQGAAERALASYSIQPPPRHKSPS